jgi:hypothetical protein
MIVVLVDDCIEFVARHATFAASALQVKDECGRRGKHAGAFVGHRTFELTQRPVLNGVFVLYEGAKMDKLSVASLALEVRLLTLGGFGDSGLPLGLFECSAGDNFRMSIADEVVIKRLVARKGALAVGAPETRYVNVGSLVLSMGRGLVESLIVLCTVTMVGCLLVTQAVGCFSEDLGTGWACIMLVCDVMISGPLIFERRLVDPEPTLEGIGVQPFEVKTPVGSALVGVYNISLVVCEGFSTRHYCTTMALEGMTEGFCVRVRRFNCRELHPTEAGGGHVCDGLLKSRRRGW